jgi:hypothetical protein
MPKNSIPAREQRAAAAGGMTGIPADFTPLLLLVIYAISIYTV